MKPISPLNKIWTTTYTNKLQPCFLFACTFVFYFYQKQVLEIGERLTERTFSSSNKHKNKTALILMFVAACVVGVVTIWHHEMWRDESQAFLLVRDSKNLADLWQNVRYEGHPFLWHFILFIAYHLCSSIYTIQVVHLLIGLLVIALVIFFSPFSLIEKSLLAFSYFLSYEYLVISRNYAVGILMLFLAIYVFQKAKSCNSIALIAVILGLCINSNIYALMIGCWLFVYCAYRCARLHRWIAFKKPLIYSVLIFAFFIGVALLQLIAPPDRTPKLSIANDINLKKAEKLSTEISTALFYMPDPLSKQAYWGSSFFKSPLFDGSFLHSLLPALPQLLAFAMIILLIVGLRRAPSLLLFFASTFISLLIFMCFIFDRGLLRHNGAFFVLVISVVWLYRSFNRPKNSVDICFDNLFKAMLVFQFLAAVIVHVDEIKYPFSGAKDAASFLVRSHRNDSDIILHPDFEGMALLHYAGISNVYYATIKGRGSFIRFNDKRKPVSYEDIYRMALKEHIGTMIFNGPKDDSVIAKMGYRLEYKPQVQSTVGDEDFYIYARVGR